MVYRRTVDNYECEIIWSLLGNSGCMVHYDHRIWWFIWQQEMSGKAEFAKAEQNRRIKIEEAKANLEAEKLNAQAEVERAKGAAEAIKIENGSITPAYIQYLRVRQQNSLNDKTVIYIPTETNLPVLEATRSK